LSHQMHPDDQLFASLPVKYREALQGMRDIPFLASRKHQEQHWRANRQGAHPGLVGNSLWKITGFERMLINRMATLGVPMYANEVVRTPERQAELKKTGMSRAGPGRSPHQYGCAVDLIHAVKGWGLTPQQWQIIGHVGQEIALPYGLKLEWGGDWYDVEPDPDDDEAIGWDPAHWQVAGWRKFKREIVAKPGLTAERIVLSQLAEKRGQ
jgi:D-alanyl-D-alanine carboxypeptidase